MIGEPVEVVAQHRGDLPTGPDIELAFDTFGIRILRGRERQSPIGGRIMDRQHILRKPVDDFASPCGK